MCDSNRKKILKISTKIFFWSSIFFIKNVSSDFPILCWNFQKIFFSFKNFSGFFSDRSKKYFLKKLRKKSEHQYRIKISLRIEWEHSQPPENTLKHSSRVCAFFLYYITKIQPPGSEILCTP